MDVIPKNHGGFAKILERKPRNRSIMGKSNKEQRHIITSWVEIEAQRMNREWAEQEAWNKIQDANRAEEMAILYEYIDEVPALPEKRHFISAKSNGQALRHAKARLERYQEELANATSESEIKKWSAYVYLVRRDYNL